MKKKTFDNVGGEAVGNHLHSPITDGIEENYGNINVIIIHYSNNRKVH